MWEDDLFNAWSDKLKTNRRYTGEKITKGHMHDWTTDTYVHPSQLHTAQIIRMLQAAYKKGITKLSCLTNPELEKYTYRIETLEDEFSKRPDLNEYL